MHYNTNRYHMLKSLGRCPYCGEKKTDDGHTLCEACREKERERRRTRRNEETAYTHFKRNENNRIAQNRRREKLRAEGKCPYCGEPALPGHLLCARHNEENNRKSRERTARARAEKEARQ